MPPIPISSKDINRLRAAVGLLPLIESGLATKTLSPERATTMTEFCSWAVASASVDDPDIDRLSDEVEAGLERVRALLETTTQAG